MFMLGGAKAQEEMTDCDAKRGGTHFLLASSIVVVLVV